MTPEQLKKKALRLGGAIEHEGKTFNAGRAKAPYAPTPAPPPARAEPTAAPAPAVVQEPAKPSAELLTCVNAMMRCAQMQSQSSAAIESAMAKIKPPMGPITYWKWTLTRDEHGRLAIIEARGET